VAKYTVFAPETLKPDETIWACGALTSVAVVGVGGRVRRT
jgi:hypothetical protein